MQCDHIYICLARCRSEATKYVMARDPDHPDGPGEFILCDRHVPKGAHLVIELDELFGLAFAQGEMDARLLPVDDSAVWLWGTGQLDLGPVDPRPGATEDDLIALGYSPHESLEDQDNWFTVALFMGFQRGLNDRFESFMLAVA